MYEMDVGGHQPNDALERIIAGGKFNDETAAFARALLNGILEHLAEIDKAIEGFATSWPSEQMAVGRQEYPSYCD